MTAYYVPYINARAIGEVPHDGLEVDKQAIGCESCYVE